MKGCETRLFRVMTALALAIALSIACAGRQPYTTKRDNTAKGAGIGAAVGAVAAIAMGEREADKILAGAAIGAVGGAGVGAYMDHQEEKLARIPGTTVERLVELLGRHAFSRRPPSPNPTST